MLYGPPGCGKTYIAKKLSEEIDYSFFEVVVIPIQILFKNIGLEAVDVGYLVVVFKGILFDDFSGIWNFEKDYIYCIWNH